MTRTFLWNLFIMGWLLPGLASATTVVLDSPRVTRTVTVADAIQMRRLADPLYFAGGPSEGRVAHFSPDGKRFVVLLRTGNLDRNTNDFSLLLYETSDVFSSPKPQRLLTMSSSSNRDAIVSLKWLNDDETIVFLGEKAGEVAQIYALNIRTRQPKRLTNHTTPITAFDVVRDGREIVFAADATTTSRADEEEIRREGLVIGRQSPTELLAGNCVTASWDRTELFLQQEGKPAIRIPTEDGIWAPSSPVSISPDGKYAVLSAFVREIPRDWEDYTDKNLYDVVRRKLRAGQISRSLQRYLLLDTTTRSLTPLLNAPLLGVFGDVAWTKNSKSVSLKSFLPLNVADRAERREREEKSFRIQVEIPGRNFRKLSDEDWARAIKSDTVPVEVTLDEDMNTPPKIYVLDPTSHQKILLLDLNPQFSELRFGRVEPVTWTTTDGFQAVGGLYLPPDYVPGKRYPLVIQTHGFQKGKFWIDGPWSSAFAAQPLAAQGMIVLQVGGPKLPPDTKDYANTVNEGPRNMAAYVGAIEYLDRRGLIDKNLVGIVGFSRTVYYVEYTLTHSKYRFAAATLVDGIDAGYFNHIAFAYGDDVHLNGSLPLGEGLKLWLQNSPGFNLDKVDTPIRLVALGRPTVLGLWESFSLLSEMGKPVDFILLPDAQHLVVKPWERIVTQQGLVDWFRYWLEGEEDPEPAKAEQYARWRELRKLQEQDQKKGVVPAK